MKCSSIPKKDGAHQMSMNVSKGNHHPLNTTSSWILLENSWRGLAQVLGSEQAEIAEGHLEDFSVTQQ